MTVDEYRKIHKSCYCCEYFAYCGKGFVCKAKNKTLRINRGRFCVLYKAREWKDR